MPFGPGKYDDLATVAREDAEATGVLLLILGGEMGSGFSVQIPPELVPKVPEMLRDMARGIEES